MSNQVPVTDNLFTGPGGDVHLLASRCQDCGNHMFPVQQGCSKCGGATTETVQLGRRGILWTWTVQSYPPKSPPYAGNADPETFQPYGVGYVEIDGHLLVESRLTIADPGELKIGMELELTLEPLYINDAGDEVVTFAFGPVSTEPEMEHA